MLYDPFLLDISKRHTKSLQEEWGVETDSIHKKNYHLPEDDLFPRMSKKTDAFIFHAYW